MNKLYVCRWCSHEWISTYEHNCEWCNSPSYFINEFVNPLQLTSSEMLDPLIGYIYKTKDILKDTNETHKNNVKYTYRRKCN